MLKLKGVTKQYKAGDTTVHALQGINLEFRESEFVSILGQSGCGKTTMLNIIGGLDQYTEGDLVINGKSTKDFKNKDWDRYRNHSIGFVFQSYNLIPHQTVLSNVELALTLSGISKSERKQRAKEALEKVGLGDQLHKKPNQMSGGQMQRVAIARALVNNPDIILADEPTGALDSETSIQVMEILKSISKEKLIIMVTHNPEIAEKYSSRIIKLLDGKIIGDTNPYNSDEEEKEIKKQETKENKKKSMSHLTAMSLSLNNLMTKKGRTLLTAFAGSIGIIGIALILALSNGIQSYITRTEEDTLSSYPIVLEKEAMDVGNMLSAFTGSSDNSSEDSINKQKPDTVYSNNVMTQMMDTMMQGTTTNNLSGFKEYLENNEDKVSECSNEVRYSYSTPLNVYLSDTKNGVVQVNPGQVMSALGFTATSMIDANSYMSEASSTSTSSQYDVWSQLSSNQDVLDSTFDIVKGRMPEKYNEVVIIIDKNNQMSDFAMYALGIMDSDKLTEMMEKRVAKEDVKAPEQQNISYNELMDIEFKLITNTAYYEKQSDDTWKDMSKNQKYMKEAIDKSEAIKVVGIIMPAEDSSVETTGGVGYTSELMEHLIEQVNSSEIVKYQKNNKDTDIFTGIKFDKKEKNTKFTMDDVNAYMEQLTGDEKTQMQQYIAGMKQSGMSDEDIVETFAEHLTPRTTENTYDGNLAALGVADINEPSVIEIYPKDFEAKDEVTDIISNYNKEVEESDQITYTDYVGIMMSSVTTIINAISYVLIGFVSISLIVSSIMIGIITYISVLERTKEIGILRAIGASKRDISRVFDAETLIVGFCAGIIGIGVTLLLTVPINALIESLAGISNVAKLPWQGGLILVLISMFLTFIAGLIPAKMAAKKDPVEALRTE